MGRESCPQVSTHWLSGAAVSRVSNAQPQGVLTPVSDKPSAECIRERL